MELPVQKFKLSGIHKLLRALAAATSSSDHCFLVGKYAVKRGRSRLFLISKNDTSIVTRLYVLCPLDEISSVGMAS